jgi:hypothetical protein
MVFSAGNRAAGFSKTQTPRPCRQVSAGEHLQIAKGTGSPMKNAEIKNVSSFRLTAGTAILGLVLAVGFAPAPAAAQGTPQQQQACTPDVMRLCNQFIPDVAKISVCMAHNRANISQACRDAFPVAHGRKRTTHHTTHHSSTH